MAYYTYEYFCGANVVVEADGQPLFEAAGISYRINESRVPLYGYSSRHFDAVARGQVLVQGSIIINYVHQDYLYRAIEAGREFRGNLIDDLGLDPQSNIIARTTEVGQNLDSSLSDGNTVSNLQDEILGNPESSYELVKALQNKYWPASPPAGVQFYPDAVSSLNPHDMNSSTELKITFGNRSTFNGRNGVTGVLLSGVYFLGRGKSIQIDEEVIVEEYNFIARNEHTLKNNSTKIGVADVVGGESVYSLFSDGPAEVVFDTPSPFDRQN